MMKPINSVMATIPPSGIRRFFNLASEVEGVISLGVGEPDFDTPWHIREEAIYAIQQGSTHYTANLGLEGLRQAACDYMERRFNLRYDWKKECLVTVGGSEAIDLCMRTLIEPGDEVILVQPGYVAYMPAVLLSRGKMVLCTLDEASGFKLTAEQLKSCITEKTKAIIINFPGNPTGGVMSYEDYEELVPLIRDSGIYVISDEIYAELNYQCEHASLAMFEEIKDQIIVIGGLSKAYSMTGWRIGFVYAHADIIANLNLIHQYTIMCPSTISQVAGIEALKHGDKDVQMMKESFEKRRNLVVNRLNRMGLDTPLPQGAFYVFACIRKTGMTSEQFCEELLHRKKVAVVPGDAFGASGEGFIRISYAYSIEELKAALDKIKEFLQEL